MGQMEVLTSKATRRSSRIRVEIPVVVTSLDRARPFTEECMVMIVSAQGCGFRCSRSVQLETPVILSNLPGGGSVTARVANCLPLGNDGKFFLIGASLYTHGNVWGIADPPADWGEVAPSVTPNTTGKAAAASAQAAESKHAANKQAWPYNLFSSGNSTLTHKK